MTPSGLAYLREVVMSLDFPQKLSCKSMTKELLSALLDKSGWSENTILYPSFGSE